MVVQTDLGLVHFEQALEAPACFGRHRGRPMDQVLEIPSGPLRRTEVTCQYRPGNTFQRRSERVKRIDPLPQPQFNPFSVGAGLDGKLVPTRATMFSLRLAVQLPCNVRRAGAWTDDFMRLGHLDAASE